jgi:hypothetical protein
MSRAIRTTWPPKRLELHFGVNCDTKYAVALESRTHWPFYLNSLSLDFRVLERLNSTKTANGAAELPSHAIGKGK